MLTDKEIKENILNKISKMNKEEFIDFLIEYPEIMYLFPEEFLIKIKKQFDKIS